MLNLVLVIAALFCAYQVMRAERLLHVSLWLAVVSALVATMLYQLGAPEVAVIELSVGAGLVTVLFVFAFSIIGEETLDMRSLVPRPLIWGMVGLITFLLGWFILPQTGDLREAVELPFSQVLWEQRGLDVIAQMILIFAGVLGLMGLLSERAAHQPSTPSIIETLRAQTAERLQAEEISPPASEEHPEGIPGKAGLSIKDEHQPVVEGSGPVK